MRENFRHGVCPRPLTPIARVLGMALMVFALSGCGIFRGGELAPMGQASFAQYREETREWIERKRIYQTENRQAETDVNCPAEWRPEAPLTKGILLVHGLCDSPWYFSDIAPQLTARGFLVRTLLLPGCGTKPADMIPVSVDDWRRVLAEQAAIMQREVSHVYLGGFSTGGNLVLEYAMHNPDIQGLLLFSPAFRSRNPLDFMAPVFAVFMDWVIKPDAEERMQSPMYYKVVPVNAFAQFYHSSSAARAQLRKKAYDKPALIVLSEQDSVIDTKTILKYFDQNFTHPDSRLIWYGNQAKTEGLSQRVLVKPDSLPEWRIHSFSHVAPLFSPSNPEYGHSGSSRVCWDGQDKKS